jgi:hypothetical protein
MFTDLLRVVAAKATEQQAMEILRNSKVQVVLANGASVQVVEEGLVDDSGQLYRDQVALAGASVRLPESVVAEESRRTIPATSNRSPNTGESAFVSHEQATSGFRPPDEAATQDDRIAVEDSGGGLHGASQGDNNPEDGSETPPQA